MATTYAAYYNLHVAAQNSANSSRRPSEESRKSTSSTSSRFSLKSAMNALKPTTEDITPSGIYTPIIKKGSLFEGLKTVEKAQPVTPIYAGLTRRERPLFGRSKKSANKV